MVVPPPADALVARFRADLAACAGGLPDRLGLAVSGGPDSLALLLLAHAALPDRVSAATVDHRLRPESAAEAAFVAALCADLGIPHMILADAPPSGASMQAQARDLRYRLLGQWAAANGLTNVATAHHADDQAETLLMRLGRGSGLPGLAGIRAARPLHEGAPVSLVRPLLAWRRDELAGVVAAAGLDAVDDPSNRASGFDRTRFRALLAATDLLAPPRLAAAAGHLADCEEALAWAADAAWALRATSGEELVLDPGGLPRELVRRLARRAIETVRAQAGLTGAWREDGLERLLATLIAGGQGSLAGVLCAGGALWRFRQAPPRRSSRTKL